MTSATTGGGGYSVGPPPQSVVTNVPSSNASALRQQAPAGNTFSFGRHSTPPSRGGQQFHVSVVEGVNASRQRASSAVQMAPPSQGSGGLLPHPGFPHQARGGIPYAPPAPYFHYGAPPHIAVHPPAIINPALLQSQQALQPASPHGSASVLGSDIGTSSNTPMGSTGSGGNSAPAGPTSQLRQSAPSAPRQRVPSAGAISVSADNFAGLGGRHPPLGPSSATMLPRVFAGHNLGWKEGFYHSIPLQEPYQASPKKNDSAVSLGQENIFFSEFGHQQASRRSNDDHLNNIGAGIGS